jgi:threonine/homoserine/homoserine lactone efflux protein
VTFAAASAVAALWGVAVVTPGPNFLAAATMAAGRNRRAGLHTVAGIGAGTLLWGLAGCFGVRALFAVVPWFYVALKLAGAVYLGIVGVRMIAGSLRPAAAPRPLRAQGPAWRVGLLTSLSNPKSALFVSALFAAVLPADASFATGLSAAGEMVAISVFWYGLVVCLLSTRIAAAAYLRLRRWIDAAAGVVFTSFGARLLAQSL